MDYIMFKTVELFCGTKSFSTVAKINGFITFTVDIDSRFKADITSDILNLTVDNFPKDIDILWASPPCNCFSVASIGKYWNKDYTPKTIKSAEALRVLEHTINLIQDINPKYFVIENPRAMMRKTQVMQQFLRHTVTYCQYGEKYMKPTDLWSNTFLILKQPCKNGAPCHESAPRGSKKGVQGIRGAENRGIVPKELCASIINQLKKRIIL